MSTLVMQPELVIPEQQLAQQATSLPDRARAIRITDQITYDLAAEFVLGVAALRKEIEQHYADPKAKAFAAHRAICDAERKMLDPVTQAERTVKSAIGAWETEQRRIAAEAARKAQEEADRLAAEELERSLMQAEAEGASAREVAAMIEQPVIAPRVEVAPAYKPAAGISVRESWSAEVVDVKALCRAVADGAASANLVAPNMVALNQMARAMRETFAVPGCRAVKSAGVAIGGRR